jgi:hypothetical protein
MENKIRIIKTFVSEVKNPDTEYLSSIREFDNIGRETYLKEYDEENNVIFEHKIETNADGNPINEETISYTDDYGEKKHFTWDEKGRLKSEKIEYDGGWFSIKMYERNADKKLLKITTVDEDGEVEESNETIFTEKDDILSYTEFDETGKQKLKTVNTYREDGFLIMKEEYSDSKKPDKTHHYYYNESGLLTAVQTLNSSGRSLDWAKVNYDEKNRPIEQLTMSGAKISLEYNEETGEITETHFASNGEVVSMSKTLKNADGYVVSVKEIEKVTRYVYEYF